MKRYIAVSAKGGNSGIQTKAKAVKWAESQVSQVNGPVEVWITEVQEVVERTTPPVHMRPFAAEGDAFDEAA